MNKDEIMYYKNTIINDWLNVTRNKITDPNDLAIFDRAFKTDIYRPTVVPSGKEWETGVSIGTSPRQKGGVTRAFNEGGRVGLAEGTSLLDKTLSTAGKGLDAAILKPFGRAFGPPGTALYMYLFDEKPDPTSAVQLMVPAFWNQIMKQFKWEDKSTDPLRRRLFKAAKRGLIPTRLMPAISRATGIGSALMTAKYVAEESEPNILQGKFNPEKADQVFPALIEGYEKKWMGKDESPYMDYSDAMLKMKDPDDLKATYIRNQMRENQNQGGRVGFDKGSKPKSPGRRTFLKGITALAALPIVGRFFKLGKVLERASTYTGPAIQKIKGMPEWFPSLVKKLWNEGEDVTKQMAYGERQIVKRGTLEGGDDVDMIYEMDTGNVSINVTPKKGTYETKSGAYNKEYSLDYTKGEVIDDVDVPQTGTIDPKTGYTKKVPDEFGVGELEPRQMGPDDFELDGTMTTIDDAMSDLTELEAFAKSKSTKQIHKKKGTKPKDVFPDYDYDPLDDY